MLHFCKKCHCCMESPGSESGGWIKHQHFFKVINFFKFRKQGWTAVSWILNPWASSVNWPQLRPPYRTRQWYLLNIVHPAASTSHFLRTFLHKQHPHLRHSENPHQTRRERILHFRSHGIELYSSTRQLTGTVVFKRQHKPHFWNWFLITKHLIDSGNTLLYCLLL